MKKGMPALRNGISIPIILMLALAVVGIFAITRANSRFVVEPPLKQTAQAHATIRAATAEAGPHAPKLGLGLPTSTEPASCPYPSPQATYVGPMGPDTGAPPFFSSEVNVNSEAIVTAGNNYYTIWLGAPGEHPNQGLIRVLVQSADPCVSHRLGTSTPSVMTDYLTPNGPLSATKVRGNILFYSIEGGGSGAFNFVTGQFVP